MKFASVLFFLLSMKAGAQTCAPATKDMAQYFSQAQWRASSVSGEGLAAVQGFTDADGNFRFGNLSRGGNVRVNLSVEAKNREFFRNCREGATSYLSSMRRAKENNVYKISARYLPSFAAFPNNPFELQKWRQLKSSLAFVFGAGAVEDGFIDKPRAAFVKAMNAQMTAQKEVGAIELDLSGWDDVVCDLVQGRISMAYEGQGVSESPVIMQRKVIDPNDLRLAYTALKTQILSGTREMNIFLAGRVLARLEQERRIGTWGDRQSFEVLKKLAAPDFSRLSELDEAGLQCASDQLQNYAREIENNLFSFKLAVPSLDEIESQVKK